MAMHYVSSHAGGRMLLVLFQTDRYSVKGSGSLHLPEPLHLDVCSGVQNTVMSSGILQIASAVQTPSLNHT